MQNPIFKLWHTSIISKKPGFFGLKNWKLSRAPTAIEFNIFWENFPHAFYLVMSTKDCVELFFVLLRSWVIKKSVNN